MRQTLRALGVGVGLMFTLLAPSCVGPGLVGDTPEDSQQQPPTDRKPQPDAGDAKSPQQADEAPAPSVDTMLPTTAMVGAETVPVLVRGAGFVERTTLQVGGVAIPTQVVSSTELRASISSRWLANAGEIYVSVGTAPPGGGATVERPFLVVFPKPFVTTLSPAGVRVGAGETAVTISGSNFTSSTKVRVDGMDMVSKVIDSSHVEVMLPASKFTASGVLAVCVWNPAPGGGESGNLSFIVSNPNVTITQLAPSVLQVGDPATDLLLAGVGFVPASTVLANGQALPTTYVSPSSLRARFSNTALAANLSVVVSNPPPGGGMSDPVQLSVVNPLPVLTSLSTSLVPAGSGDTQLTLTGSSFVPMSTVTAGGQPVATSVTSPTRLTVIVPARMLATGGFLAMQVQNPAPGGGSSAPIDLMVGNPAPKLLTISSSNIPRGTKTTVTLTTTGVVPGAIVYLGSAAMTTRIGINGSLSADLIWPDHAVVPLRVRNPAPGGGDSNAMEITVDCDARGAELLFPTTGVTQAAQTNLANQSRYASFDGPMPGVCSTVTGGTTPQIDRTTTQPVRAVVVQNTSFAPVSLEAWANCPVRDGAAYLALYPGRKTMPTSYDDRRMCTGMLARGGRYASPDSPSAAMCPGLTVANGGAVALDVCETAVVYLQAVNDNAVSSLPNELRIRTQSSSAAANP